MFLNSFLDSRAAYIYNVANLPFYILFNITLDTENMKFAEAVIAQYVAKY